MGALAGDLEAALGLVNLCRKTRMDRRNTYRAFLAAWRRLRSDQVLESLPALMQAEPPVSAPTKPLKEKKHGARRPAAESPTEPEP